jgi:pimeloyl-ACP methyl ester carboxylesterase
MSIVSPYAALLAEVPPVVDSVEVLGTATKYWAYGPSDASTTLVLVHGYRGDHHGLEPVVAQLRDVRIIAPDLPGFGGSEPFRDRAHDIAGYAAWLGDFVAALGLGNAVVLGHSFGSIVVSHAVASGVLNPPKLILVNPIAALATSGPNVALTRVAVLGYKASARLPQAVGRWLIGSWGVVRVMSNVMATTSDKATRAWIHGQHHAYFSDFATMTSVVEGFEASVSQTVGDVASTISIPTLLIGAELDPITSVPAVHALADSMPDATLRMIPGVGHLIHYEQPRAAAEFIVEFLGAGRLADPEG